MRGVRQTRPAAGKQSAVLFGALLLAGSAGGGETTGSGGEGMSAECILDADLFGDEPDEQFAWDQFEEAIA